MKRASKFFFESLFYSRFFLLIGLIVLVFIAVELGQVLIRRNEINNEIAALEKQISELEGKNRDVKELIDYFKTSSFTEEQARLKLGLVKEGESAVIIPQEEKNQTAEPEPAKASLAMSNPAKWWHYFFK